MSTLSVETVEITVEPHPNAEKLELAKFGGVQVVVGKGEYKTGDKVVYCPPDTVITEAMKAKFNLPSTRIKAVKLRGQISNGFVFKHDESLVVGPCDNEATECMAYGLTKYVQPAPSFGPMDVRKEKAPDVTGFDKYTDIENVNRYKTAIPTGTKVALTEKLHGTNFRAFMDKMGELHVGSRKLVVKPNPDNLYWKAAISLQLKDKLKPGMAVFGEIFGLGVQDLTYRLQDKKVSLFDIQQDGIYYDYEAFLNTCADNKWPCAPLLQLHDWWGLEKFLEHMAVLGRAEGSSNGYPSSYESHGQLMEGVVIRPMKETFSDELGGRMILKHINPNYLVRKNGTEYQ